MNMRVRFHVLNYVTGFAEALSGWATGFQAKWVKELTEYSRVELPLGT